MGDFDFGGGKGTNLGDAKFGRDGVNLQTLLRILAVSGGSSSASISGGVLSISEGTNILTGGTDTKPSIATSLVPVFTSVRATSLSGGTIFSGSTNLEDIFSTINGSGTVYTPILTNILNIFSSTTFESQYIVYQNSCTVSGKITINPIDIAVSTRLGISFPVDSDLVSEQQCAGTAFSYNIATQGGAILGDATNNRAELRFISTDLSSQDMSFSFTYKIN